MWVVWSGAAVLLVVVAIAWALWLDAAYRRARRRHR